MNNDIQDLTQKLEEAQKQLSHKELLFDNILESTLAGYWDWHIPDNQEYLSPTFKKMFGYEDDEMPNAPESWQKIMYPEDLDALFALYQKHVESKGTYPFDIEARYFHKDGSTVWVYCRGKVVEWDENGNPLRMVGSHVDITKLKRSEEIEKYARQLEFKNKELEQFAYVTSHDLQEPLRTISSFTHLLEEQYKDQLDESANKYLFYLSQASNRMSTLIKDLLDYSRIGVNKEKSMVDCNVLMRLVQEDFLPKINEIGATLIIENLPVVHGYEMDLRLLFQNILSNALKFRKKEEPLSMKISAIQEDKFWKFTFQDNGIGIASTQKERIFTIFQRLHNQSDYEGTGIGLAHCKKIVDLHGGKIWVQSELNTGSIFYFTIPI